MQDGSRRGGGGGAGNPPTSPENENCKKIKVFLNFLSVCTIYLSMEALENPLPEFQVPTYLPICTNVCPHIGLRCGWALIKAQLPKSLRARQTLLITLYTIVPLYYRYSFRTNIQNTVMNNNRQEQNLSRESRAISKLRTCKKENVVQNPRATCRK